MTGPNGQEQFQLRQSGPPRSAGWPQFTSTASSSAIHGISPLSPLPRNVIVHPRVQAGTFEEALSAGSYFQADVETGATSGSQYPRGRLTGPIQFLSRLLELWRLDREEACYLLGYERKDQNLVEDLLNGSATLRGRDPKDRIAILFRIRSLLAGLFPRLEAENEWLRTPLKALSQRSPLELLREGSMENLLTLRQLIEHGMGL